MRGLHYPRHAYMAQIIKTLRVDPILINGVRDPIYLFFRLPPALAVADLMEKVKAKSSRWVHQGRGKRREFAWQTGFTALSASQPNAGRVRRYIADQEKHHRPMTYREEVYSLTAHGEAAASSFAGMVASGMSFDQMASSSTLPLGVMWM